MPRQRLLHRKKTAWTLIVAAGVIGVRLVAQQSGQPVGDGAPPPPVVRTDISGDWTYANNEDQPHRVPGPELGDYTGLPLNNADRQKADAWDATILSQPERQAQPHPAQYLMRGPGPALRIVKILDPITQELVAYTPWPAALDAPIASSGWTAARTRPIFRSTRGTASPRACGKTASLW